MLNGNGSVLRLTLFDTGSSERKRSEEHTSELQSRLHLVCRLLLEKKKTTDHKVRFASTHLKAEYYCPNSVFEVGGIMVLLEARRSAADRLDCYRVSLVHDLQKTRL